MKILQRKSNVICIEDDPEKFESLQKLLEKHGLSGRFGLVNAFCQKRQKEIKGIFMLISDISALIKEKDSDGLPDFKKYIDFLKS